ncbi:MAG: hypothetical protein K2N14_00255 [Clostridia bacterium]|nr:hypothetical protein [Clostridia bacterium]
MKIGKIKGLLCSMLCCAMLLTSTLVCFSAKGVYAAPQDYAPETAEDDAGEIQPRWTDLSLSINGGNGKVWATVKNDFTLFFSTVTVVVFLYSSDTYAESYEDMTLVSTNEIRDLDVGKTITTEAETGGVEKFWLARMRYNINSGGWESRQTAACRISGTGEFLGYT